MHRIRSQEMGQRSVPAPFLMKTYQLVDDPRTDDVISWNESGATFVIWKTAELAEDLLPNYFKHNNFSSFVRQLNTYGFRKIVADKWEFASENFRRGHKELLAKIHRRKTVTPPAAQTSGKAKATSPSNSGHDIGSTSTSSPYSKNQGSVETAKLADLSNENAKLRRDNKTLISELAQAKKQCDELMNFLTEYVKVGPDRIHRTIRQTSCGSNSNGVGHDDDHEEKQSSDGDLRLFGVWMKGEQKKRAREENTACGVSHDMKNIKFGMPNLIKRRKVCN